jgi:hypothetical protein
MLQHLRLVQGGRDKVGVFDDILYHFPSSLVKDNVSHLYANVFHQTKMFMLCKRKLKLRNKARNR